MLQRTVFLGLLFLCQLTHAADHAYVLNAQGSSISAYTLLPSGLPDYAGHWPTSSNPTALAIHPNGRFLYVTSKAADKINVFRMQTVSGKLVEIDGSPFAVRGRSLFDLSFHPSGRFLYGAGRFSGVSALQVDGETGAIADIEGSPFPAQERTRSVAVHGSGKFLYASNAYSNSISAYRIDQTSGQLHELQASPYAAGHTGRIGKQGLPLIDLPALGGGVPYNVVLHPNGRFLLASNWAGASVSVFRIDPNSGELTLAEGAPFATDLNPYTVAVHPGGKFVYVASWASHRIQVFSFHEDTGALILLPGQEAAAEGQAPITIKFDGPGKVAYVLNNWTNTLVRFQVQADGSLRRDTQIQTRSGPHALALWTEANENKTVGADVLLVAQASGRLALLPAAAHGQARTVVNVEGEIGTGPLAVHGQRSLVFDVAASSGVLRMQFLHWRQGQAVLEPVASVSLTMKVSALLLDEQNDYLYVLGDSGAVSVFRITDQSLMLLPMDSLTVDEPLTLAVLDSGQRFLFGVNADHKHLHLLRYQTDHGPIARDMKKYGSPLDLGFVPEHLVTDAEGNHLLMVDAATASIRVYAHDFQSGLPLLPAASVLSGYDKIRALAFHPWGRYLLLLRDGVMNVLELDPFTGQLSEKSRFNTSTSAPKQVVVSTKTGEVFVLAHKALYGYAFAHDRGALTGAAIEVPVAADKMFLLQKIP